MPSFFNIVLYIIIIYNILLYLSIRDCSPHTFGTKITVLNQQVRVAKAKFAIACHPSN